MTDSIHEYVLEQLQLHKGRWTEVADGSGIPKRTIEKIARREVVDPGVSKIERLAQYFRDNESAA
jgi:transcriptional regulator with XRE-family HTH domain